MNNVLKNNRVPLVVLALLAVVPLVPGLNSSYAMHIIILTLLWTVIGISWNLLSGYCGQVSFGHASFFGIGAYTAGILRLHGIASEWWGLPLSVVTVGIGALIIGFICLRLRGPYFALGTLAMGEVLRVAVENFENFTEGARGITISPRTWVDKEPYYYILLLLAVAVFVIADRIIKSKWGYYFTAIREDQDAAESLGIPTTFYKNVALVISAVFTGVAGAFYTCYMGYIDPHTVFALHDISVITIMVVMVGGVATTWGPAVGALIMIVLSEYVRTIPNIGAAAQTLFGVLLIVIIIFMPNGIVGDFGKLMRLFGRKPSLGQQPGGNA